MSWDYAWTSLGRWSFFRRLWSLAKAKIGGASPRWLMPITRLAIPPRPYNPHSRRLIWPPSNTTINWRRSCGAILIATNATQQRRSPSSEPLGVRTDPASESLLNLRSRHTYIRETPVAGETKADFLGFPRTFSILQISAVLRKMDFFNSHRRWRSEPMSAMAIFRQLTGRYLVSNFNGNDFISTHCVNRVACMKTAQLVLWLCASV